MRLTPGISKLALTGHIAVSLGWLGAVAAFLALSIAGLTSQDSVMARASYTATELVTWWVIVPLAFASFLTGLIQSLGTTWGLFQHYWVVAKLFVTAVATLILLIHTGPIGQVAAAAAASDLSPLDLRSLRIQLVADAIGASIALLVATALSVYKPRQSPSLIWLFGLLAFIVFVALAHLAGGGLHGH